jgi:anti-sigma regulatory factor (Ser/Thr protein kinase)
MKFFKCHLLFIILVIASKSLVGQKLISCECSEYKSETKEKFQQYIDKAEFEKAKLIAKKLYSSSNPSCKFSGYDQMVIVYFNQGKLDSVKIYLDKQTSFISKISCNQNAVMEYYISMAQYNFMKEKLNIGANYTLKALTIAEALKNYERQALLYNYLSLAFSILELHEKQMIYARKSIQLINKIKDSVDVINHIKDIAAAYKNYYWKTREQNIADTLKLFSNHLLIRAKQANYINGIIEGFLLMNSTSLAFKNYKLALTYIDSCEILISKSPNLNYNAQYRYKINFNKSFIYNEIKNFELASCFADSTLKYALLSRQTTIISGAYKKCYESRRSKGDFENALKFQLLYQSFKDSLLNINNKSLVSELELKYEKAKNEKTIVEINHESALKSNRIQTLIFIITIAVLVLITLIVIYRQKSIKNKQLILEAEQRLNRSRINPHFFFNALSSLQGIAVKENDGKKIATNLYKFSNLMRKTLESSFNDYITIEQELEFINQYIELQQLKSGNTFDFDVIIGHNIDAENIYIPSMIIQPFLENAIEHGFSKINYRGILTLEVAINQNNLEVVVKDNGVGIQNVENKNEQHISRAIQITKDRLYLINSHKKTPSTFSVHKVQPTGVLVKLILPLLFKNEGTGN